MADRTPEEVMANINEARAAIAKCNGMLPGEVAIHLTNADAKLGLAAGRCKLWSVSEQSKAEG